MNEWAREFTEQIAEEAGEYVFLLEKGRRYEVSLSYDLPNVSYEYASVEAKVRRALRSTEGAFLRASGSEGGYSFSAPTAKRKGWILCLPTLIIQPDCVVDPSFPVEFTACLTVPGGAAENIVWQTDRGVVETGEKFSLEASAFFKNVNIRAYYGENMVAGSITYERPCSVVSLYAPDRTIIREAAYTNTPEVVVASQTSEIKVSASWDVIASGTMRLEGEGISAIYIDGVAQALPYEWTVPKTVEGESLVFGIKNVDSFDGTRLKLTFLPDEKRDGASCSAALPLSDVKEYLVSVEAIARFPENKHRHIFGPQEEATLTISPEPSNVSWQKDGDTPKRESVYDFKALDEPGVSTIKVYADGATYTLKMQTIAPTHHIPVLCWAIIPEKENIGIELHTDLKLMPDYVSFHKLKIMEGYCEATERTGVFALPGTTLLPHDEKAGALQEVPVEEGNFAGSDRAMSSLIMSPPWRAGSYRYNIDESWCLQKGLQAWHWFHNEPAIFSLTTNGTFSVSRYGAVASRKEFGEAKIEKGPINEYEE